MNLYLSGDEEKQTVRKAFKLWEQDTCVRFTEVDMDAVLSDTHVVVTRNGGG